MPALLALAILPQGASAKMPRGSFLTRPASNPRQLMYLLKTHPLLLRRYQLVFSMSKQQLLHLFSTMHLERLSHNIKVEVWFIHRVRSGKEYAGYHETILKKGSLVFAASNGTPFLVKTCGNLISRLPSQIFLVARPSLNTGQITLNTQAFPSASFSFLPPASSPPGDVIIPASISVSGVNSIMPPLLVTSNSYLPYAWLALPALIGTVAGTGSGGSAAIGLPLPAQVQTASAAASQPSLFSPPAVPESPLGVTMLFGASALLYALSRRSHRR